MSLNITVRLARPNDAAAVNAVLEASYPRLMAPAYEAELLKRAIPAMTKANQTLLASGTYYVAEADDRVMMGCGGWTCERPGTAERQSGIAHIRHFATRADCTGRGIGRMIYGRCEAQARSAGIVFFEC